ncbi:DUF1513 domain-containing protein [Thiothrix fructosivorans]|jgi:hypothetical protein|uniref:DUF1513 domain-containing protein n=1 Tax=Thiothrix fructosivorans TaxID=111770 RepID=A0A8B0SFU2_9GAMM|nr:DUF1513 domain-containing protein [Thiothrix fructosivorans]MBO0613631.1 DUF1513 domain-containing protein [Thiothrix fructosivorans]QTX10953.1 DUF1513 domain-containing protein [Thiothrix fructosivorans]
MKLATESESRRGVLHTPSSTTLYSASANPTGGHFLTRLDMASGQVQSCAVPEQHPDFGRRKLNLDTMQPSLVYVDAASGKKIDEYRLPDHHLSIRHLLVTATGDVGVALQYEGDLYQRQPQSLVAWQTHGKDLQLLGIKPTAIQLFNGYMADLAYDPHQKILAVTSPRGNHITFWNIETQTFLSASSLTEPSGIQFMPNTETFLVSGATGELHTVTASPTEISATKLQYMSATLWDNHLVLA